jgi:hypothetical protein
MEAGLTALLVGSVVITIVAGHEAARLSDRHGAEPGRDGAPPLRVLRSTVCVAASLLVTSGLVGLTGVAAAPHDVSPLLFLSALALAAGMVVGQSAERIDALRGASRVWVGGLLGTMMWISVLLMVSLVLTR